MPPRHSHLTLVQSSQGKIWISTIWISTILPLASAIGSDWLHCEMCSVEIFMNLTWFFIWPIRQYLTKKATWSSQGIHMASHVTIFMKLTASYNMFKRGWVDQGGVWLHHYILNAIFHVQLGLTSCGYLSLTLCAPVCQYCLVRYRPTSVHVCIMCIDYPNIVVLYKSEDSF